MANILDQKPASPILESSSRSFSVDKRLKLFGVEIDACKKSSMSPVYDQESINSSDTCLPEPEKIHQENSVVSKPDEPLEEANSVRLTELKKYRCQFCSKEFANSQALGGHQNAHRRERQKKKRKQIRAGRFVFGVQSSDIGSGASTVLQNSPFQFGSSASSPVFGTSGLSSLTSSNPLFSSSASSTKLFGSGASFGLSPSTSSAETKSVDPCSGPSSGIFSFGAGASAASSGANAFSLSSGTSSTFSFGASSSATPALTNSVGSSSSTTAAIFSFGASSSSGTSMISSTAGTANSGIFGASTLSPSETNSASSSSVTSVSFGSSWQTPKSAPFSALSSSSSPSPVFSFGASSSSFSAANTAPVVFGSSTASSGPFFSFTTASATTSLTPAPFANPPVFGNSTTPFTASGNNDQMSMEDSMAEDVQAPTPAVPVFGQQTVSSSPGGFAFGAGVPQSATPFQFGGQQSQGGLQNPSPFQASGSMEFNAAGSFSLGSGGGVGDKSSRRIVKVNRTGKYRKK